MANTDQGTGTPRLGASQIRKRASQVDILLNETWVGELAPARFNENALYGGLQTDRFPLYHLVVMTTASGGPDVATALDGQALVYSFRPNPQELEMVEPAAAEVQALQDGGRYVEHHGDAVGELTVSGTTGVFLPHMPPPASPHAGFQRRPLLSGAPGELDPGIRSANGPGSQISPGLGRAWEFQDNAASDFEAGASDEKLRTAGTSYRAPVYATTGFDRIVELRAFLRLYFDLKKGKATTPDIASPGECFMTWLNLKDGEWWVVEPMVFRVPRARDFRVGYRYDLQLHVLGRMDPTQAPFGAQVDERLGGFAGAAGGGAGLLERARSWVAKANAALNELNRAIQRVQAVFNEIAELGGSVQNLVSTAFGVAHNALGLVRDVSELARDAMELVGSVAQGSVALAAVPLRDWENLTEFADQFTRSLGLLDRQLQPSGRAGASTPSTAMEEAMRELARSGKRTVNALRAGGAEGSGDPLAAAERRLALARSLDPALAAAPPVRALVEATVLEGDTIRDLARRLLGDESRWQELAVLNELVPPYVTPVGGRGLLRSGGPVLVPSAGDRAVPSGVHAAAGTRSDLAVRLYGTDLKLVDPSGAPPDLRELGDTLFSRRGRGAGRIEREIEVVREVREDGQRVFDFALTSGVANLVQALHIKAATQPGELGLHPGFGFALPIGTRLSPLSAFLAKFQAYRTLLRDDRIAAIEDIRLSGEGDVVRMHVRVRAAGTSAVVGASTPAG